MKSEKSSSNQINKIEEKTSLVPNSNKYKRELFYPILCLSLAITPWLIINYFTDYLDPMFKEIGFCQSTKIRQGYDSFEICFWVDLLGSITLYLMVYLLNDNIDSTDRSELISAIPGTIIHGAAHYYQYFNKGKFMGNGVDSMLTLRHGPWHLISGNFIFVLGFQFTLQQGLGNFYSMLGIAFLINAFQMLFVPSLYALTYVNTWIFLTDLIVKYFKPLKREEDWGDYFMKLIIIILLVEPIFEATYCENKFEYYGGHAIFDTLIIFYEFVWVGLSYYRNKNQVYMKSKIQ
jgi:hypothetical protein